MPEIGLSVVSMDEIYPFVGEGELIVGTSHNTLRRWWDAADPDSFRRREPA